MRMRVGLLLVLILLLGGGVALAGEYTNSTYQFTMDPPKNWVPLTQAQMDASGTSPGMENVAAFKDPLNATFHIDVVKVKKYENSSAGLAAFRKDLESPATEVLDAHFDEKRGALVGEVRVNNPDGAGRFLCYAFNGSDATFIVTCYGPDAGFDWLRGNYEKVADSFQIQGSAGGSGRGVVAVLGVMVCAGISLVGLVIVGAIIFLLLRKKKAAA